ncbi:NaeI family type II restriction endonuclease [Streptomyces candidus]|uniref:Type II restriction enzyme NaeI domain-containing protein n=1 Tax=Streptomyces candidus TaxID=67283 RepID=A0A7X0HIE9_9ACTN|nr:NaeI family type II restriction endonuclease [Streptomyces candidus]MBB6436942.1 hypothetical protein [Streptomyces candidus]
MPTEDAPEDMLFRDISAVSAIEANESASGDRDLAKVAQWFMDQPRMEQRFSGVFRQSIDEVLDGQRTGRYDVNDLEKTEKTYLGTKVEIVCRTEFGFSPGSRMDYQVSGVEVDSKFSLTGDWMIPREAMGHICLVMAANDRKATYGVGLVRIREELLTGRGNQDQKRRISREGRSAIKWLVRAGNLDANLLLELDEVTRRALMAVPPGQGRVDMLFRHVHGRIVDRNAVVTTAKQLDSAKRVRDARSRLRGAGIVILGHQKEGPRIAFSLGLPVPKKGTWVAARVVPVSDSSSRRCALVDGVHFAVAVPGEPECPAPAINH